MEKFDDLYGLYVECGDGQHIDYTNLKDELERKLNEAVKEVKRYNHSGFDVGMILFRNDTAVLTCCVDNLNLWIGLYNKPTKSIQRYIVFDDIKDLTKENIANFAYVIENIAKNPDRLINAGNLAIAWKNEIKIIEAELLSEHDEPDF